MQLPTLKTLGFLLLPAFLAVGMTNPLLGGEPTPKSVTFEFDVQPLLTRFGCNSGACHGKSRGQNGFALSLLGFDSDFDYSALIYEGRRPACVPGGRGTESAAAQADRANASRRRQAIRGRQSAL